MKKRMLLMAAACFVAGGMLSTACSQPPGAQGVKVHDPADLEIGKVAPDIEAEDLDGVVFKLSDYRGKVVVLDFWGDW